MPIWASDDGLITAKDLLPITGVFYGPLLYESEHANFTIGRLRCSGKFDLSLNSLTKCDTDIGRRMCTFCLLLQLEIVCILLSMFVEF